MKKSEAFAKKAKEEAAKEMRLAKKHPEGGGFGYFLLLIGVIWLAVDQGWIPEEWPIIPIVIIVLALWIILASKKKH